MQTITAEEFKKRYGDQGLAQLPSPAQKPGFFSKNFPGLAQGGRDIKQSFNAGIQQIKDAKPLEGSKNPIQAFEKAATIGSGAVNAAFSPLAPAVKPIEQDIINPLADKISNNPTVQKFANSRGGELLSRITEDLANVNNIAGAVVGFGVGKETVPAFEKPKMPEVPTSVKNFARDVTPTSQGMINHATAGALEFTPGDLNKLAKSTGNELGPWLADKNAIGANKIETQANVQKIFDDSYKGVRDEIGKVDTIYKPSQVPRYVESLKAVLKKVEDTPGMQEVGVEVENLLNKKEITLSDVQRVKELVDEHFNLYKQTGDVGEGVQKQGLANIRGDLKDFIEQEVKAKTGADIRKLNNDVSTAKGILDTIELRSPRGLTRSNLKVGDLGAFGIGLSFGGPIGGVAAVFLKKLLESPSVQLRIAKFLDTLSDASKARIKTKLESGQVPEEFNQFIKGGKVPKNLKKPNPIKG